MSKTIIITGAGTGLGAGSALGLAKAGHKVIAACHKEEHIAPLLAKAKEMGVTLDAPKLDITSKTERDAVFAAYGEVVDIVVNNAAIGEGGPIAEIPTDYVRHEFEVNVFSQLDFCQPYIKNMVKKGSGKVVFISSIAGTWTVPFLGAYCASKHAIEAIAQTMRVELASTGVKVCTINPAPFTTGFNDFNCGTYKKWFDPDKNFTDGAALSGFGDAMANQLQYDPKLMYDEMVRIIPLDNHRFRNVFTPNWEVICKQYHSELYAIDMDGNKMVDDYWGKTEDGKPMPGDLDTSTPPIMKFEEVRPMGL